MEILFVIAGLLVLALIGLTAGAFIGRTHERHNYDPTRYSTMRLRFIGLRPSMGMIPGQEYNVTIENNPRTYAVQMIRPIRCPYTTWSAFWDNWEHI